MNILKHMEKNCDDQFIKDILYEEGCEEKFQENEDKNIQQLFVDENYKKYNDGCLITTENIE